MGGVRRRGAQKQQKHGDKRSQDIKVAAENASKPFRCSPPKEASNLIPSFKEVLAAIQSLYIDELKPFGRILRKRVAERAADCDKENARDVDIKHLLTVCENNASLEVQPEEGGDWSVQIMGRHATFINVYSSLDCYPEGMWGAAAAYFQLLSGEEMKLPGGRYSCAQMLQNRNLAFLEGRSLGQICHIVQLAISQRKLLGYLNGAVVPYAFSQSMIKEQCALLKAPCKSATDISDATGTADGNAVSENALTIASWGTAREYLKEILASAPKQGEVGMVPLSNIKRIFRTKFKTEFSETKLGHSKLSELLQDSRFADICSVQLQGNGYIVFQAEPQKMIENDDTESTNSELSETSPQPTSTRLSSDLSCPSSTRRPSLDDPVKVLLRECHLSMTDPMTINDLEEQRSCHRLQFCVDEPLALEEASTSFEFAPLTQTPSGMYTHPAALRWPCLSPSLFKDCSEVLNQVSGYSQGYVEEGDSCHRMQFCPDEPLVLEQANELPESDPTEFSTNTSTWPCISPSLLKKDGCVGSIALSRVQNTFIHSPMAPPTPLRAGALRRSRSLPKNVGSDKNMLETTCQSLGYGQIPCVQQAAQLSSGSIDHKHVLPVNESLRMTTPSIYTNYIPPSPALTASPMYSMSEAEASMSHYMWPAPAVAPMHVISQPIQPISLAYLLQ